MENFEKNFFSVSVWIYLASSVPLANCAIEDDKLFEF